MKSRAGFTLIEAVIVIAVMGILAAAAGAMLKSARGNAGTSAAAYDLVVRLQGLKTRALADQKDYLLLLLNPAGDDAMNCSAISTKRCLRWYVLASPTSSWTLNGFTASAPTTNAAVLQDSGSFERGVVVDFGTTGLAGPAPFDTVLLLASSIQGTCTNEDGAACHCLAVRYGADGEVHPVLTASVTPPPSGMSFGLVSQAVSQRTAATTRRTVLVSSPTGLVRSYIY